MSQRLFITLHEAVKMHLHHNDVAIKDKTVKGREKEFIFKKASEKQNPHQQVLFLNLQLLSLYPGKLSWKMSCPSSR